MFCPGISKIHHILFHKCLHQRYCRVISHAREIVCIRFLCLFRVRVRNGSRKRERGKGSASTRTGSRHSYKECLTRRCRADAGRLVLLLYYSISSGSTNEVTCIEKKAGDRPRLNNEVASSCDVLLCARSFRFSQ